VPEHGAENRFAIPFVWTGTMRAIELARPMLPLEGTLDAGGATETRERFLRLAGRELDRAYRLAGLLLSDRNEAEDATQEALLRAWRNLGSLRDQAGFAAWFDRILVNVCRDRLRRRAKIRFLPLEVDGVERPVADPFRTLLDRDEATRALAGLEPDERVVVVLHFWADLTLAAVAERTGWPVGTVKSRLHRALGKLEARLDAPSETPR
jgi:RNA polymerase sigma-70 factor (ECF subfamily)